MYLLACYYNTALHTVPFLITLVILCQYPEVWSFFVTAAGHRNRRQNPLPGRPGCRVVEHAHQPGQWSGTDCERIRAHPRVAAARVSWVECGVWGVCVDGAGTREMHTCLSGMGSRSTIAVLSYVYILSMCCLPSTRPPSPIPTPARTALPHCTAHHMYCLLMSVLPPTDTCTASCTASCTAPHISHRYTHMCCLPQAVRPQRLPAAHPRPPARPRPRPPAHRRYCRLLPRSPAGLCGGCQSLCL